MTEPAPATDKALRLSVIIPTFNRAQILASSVKDVLNQNYRDYELWVIDQSAPDQAAANRAFIDQTADPRLHYLHLDKTGLPNARNEGLRRAKGEIVLFLDDDVILLTPDFLTAHLAAYDDPKVGGVTGRHVERTLHMNSKRTACHVAWSGRTIFNLFGTERQEIGTCKGSNMSFRKSVTASVGGFDRKTNMLEDADFSVRVADAGWILMYEPAAELVHLSVAAGGVREKSAVETEYRRFSSTAYYILKHRGFWGCVPFVATFMVIAATRLWRYRSLTIFPGYIKALRGGFALARTGADQVI
ncbi:MAG: glycosyltransferase family 2 protein [Alphaproteobacteria bacterium]|nr:glycosyltransferase family 2 protein [Alphaproteobacteria bacterium]